MFGKARLSTNNIAKLIWRNAKDKKAAKDKKLRPQNDDEMSRLRRLV